LISFGTAWHMLAGKAQVQGGQTVLVCGAAGGLGMAAVQVATYLGARVIAAAGSQRRLAHAAALGAATVDYATSDLVAAVLDLTEGRGCDVVIEHIGGRTFEQAVACTAIGGCVVTAGAHAGELVALDVIPFFRRELRLYGSRGQSGADLAQVIELLRLRAIDPVFDRVVPLELAADVHRAMDDRELVGKALLRS
jgi:NADPH:quinone reductase-like Zn-dependent oxidoreductase